MVDGTRPHSVKDFLLPDPVHVVLPTMTMAPAVDSQQQSARGVMLTALTTPACGKGAVHQGLLLVGSAQKKKRKEHKRS